MKRRLIAASSMSFIFVITAGIPVSNAVPGPSGPTATAAEAEDIATMAQGLGISGDSASAVLAGGGAFNALVEDLRTRFPDDFADAAYASMDGDAAWIAFQGALPEGALGLIEALPFDVEIRTNFVVSETERGLATGAALGAFSDVVHPVTASASIEPGATEIHIVYQGGILPTGVDLDSVVLGAAETAVRELDDFLTFTVTYEQMGTPTTEPEVLPGVMAISDRNGVMALVATANPAAHNEAVVSGRVEKLSGVCVGITTPGGSDAVVVWPAGTTFAEDSSGLRVPGYGAVTYGSQLTTGGGFATIDELGFRAELPRDCDATDVAFIAAEPD